MALEAPESRSNGLSYPTCYQCPMFEEPTVWCLLNGGYVMAEQKACDEFRHWWPAISETRSLADTSERKCEYILRCLNKLEAYLANETKTVLMNYGAFHTFMVTLRKELEETYGHETKREVLVEERAGGHGVPWA